MANLVVCNWLHFIGRDLKFVIPFYFLRNIHNCNWKVLLRFYAIYVILLGLFLPHLTTFGGAGLLILTCVCLSVCLSELALLKTTLMLYDLFHTSFSLSTTSFRVGHKKTIRSYLLYFISQLSSILCLKFLCITPRILNI